MTDPVDWHARFLILAEYVGEWSKDPRTGVGAVLVDDLRRVVGIGYNGFPRGVDDSPAVYADREEKLLRVVHAEVNAVLNATRATDGATCYCTLHPCSACAGVLIQAGIRRVVIPRGTMRAERSHEVAREMLVAAGVEIVEL